MSVLRELVRLPAALAFRSQDPVGLCRNHFGSLSEAQAPFGVDDLKSAVAKMSTLAEDDINMVEVPKHLERSFIRVGCDLANHLPHGALSSTEMTLFFDGAVRQSSGIFKPAQRKSIQDISWLPTRLVGNRRFLSLSCIDPKATRVAAELVAWLTSEAYDCLENEESRHRFILGAVSRTLLRAYAEGCRTVLARHVPTLFDSQRDRPHLTEPWIMVGKEAGLSQAQWVWARAPNTKD